MLTTTTNTDVHNEAKPVSKTTMRFSTPDRTTATLAAAPRPAVEDDDAQWVTQRMFDHYNG